MLVADLMMFERNNRLGKLLIAFVPQMRPCPIIKETRQIICLKKLSNAREYICVVC